MSLKKFSRAMAVWFWGLLGGAIGGGCSAIMSKLGMDGLHSAGFDVPQITWKAAEYIFLVGMGTHAVMYYMKSPLPPLTFDDNTAMFKNPNIQVTNETTPTSTGAGSSAGGK